MLQPPYSLVSVEAESEICKSNCSKVLLRLQRMPLKLLSSWLATAAIIEVRQSAVAAPKRRPVEYRPQLQRAKYSGVMDCPVSTPDSNFTWLGTWSGVLSTLASMRQQSRQ